MKILIYTPLFYPSMGGLENIMRWLAEDFSAAGDEVTVVCQTPNKHGLDKLPFPVVRNPSARDLLALTKSADVFFQGCVSLKGIWPLFFTPRKTYVISHQTWYAAPGEPPSLAARVKRAVARHASLNISCSSAIARELHAESVVVPNCYDDSLFRISTTADRTRDFIFVGRLVSDKGADLILTALSMLRERGHRPSVTVVGSGPEGEALKQQALELKLDHIQFAGPKRGAELAAALNAHRVLVVPSRWKEPFGIVALEGIACGCAVIASSGGGLPEAVGDCGVLFENGDATALAEKMVSLLESPDKIEQLQSHRERHLPSFSRLAVSSRYRELILGALKN